MINDLKIKCENLMTFIPSNLYIHSSIDDKTITFSKLTIPTFLTHYIEDSVSRLMKDKQSLKTDSLIDNQVYYYIDPFKMCYLTWAIIDENNAYYTITLGPLITEHLVAEEIKYMGYKMKLSADNIFILESFYEIVPYYDHIQIARIASIFLDYLPLKPHLPQIIREDHSVLLPEEAQSIEKKFKTFDFVQHNYSSEEKILHAIEIGDVDFIKCISSKLENSMTIPPRFPSDPLRESKNLSISFNSICLRAALKGGLNQSTAHGLSHNFAVKIEKQMCVEAIAKLDQEIMMTYAESVKKYALKGYSELITNAINYIRIHLVEHISLKNIAKELHVSKEHLSRKFKKELNMTPTEFIHKTKIEESLYLLKSKIYSISDIAYTFGYSSPAHYTKMFKKYMDISPTQYQK
ncbi:hypothetical protein SH1V18_21340 [Vallitalea longa]|uniref:HTH araC/xylS-type domain-containing protein n=1 Tax=Vallitalea longa TaxID=2936439 RepID=A0A9W5YAQ4_9FIRM|nr:helix-turn-helix domain-containing protein [Vallitalea longa]GKX29654.1 hypothetical protein SH1V18_21340 [Vallitalea longa]